jgi:hypothetical protein
VTENKTEKEKEKIKEKKSIATESREYETSHYSAEESQKNNTLDDHTLLLSSLHSPPSSAEKDFDRNKTHSERKDMQNESQKEQERNKEKERDERQEETHVQEKLSEREEKQQMGSKTTTTTSSSTQRVSPTSLKRSGERQLPREQIPKSNEKQKRSREADNKDSNEQQENKTKEKYDQDSAFSKETTTTTTTKLRASSSKNFTKLPQSSNVQHSIENTEEDDVDVSCLSLLCQYTHSIYIRMLSLSLCRW